MTEMTEKTERLRDLFMSVTDADTVTEQQQAGRGSLTTSATRINERLESVIGRMRDRYEFETTLSDVQLYAVVKGFYGDDTDEEIASDLDNEVTAEDVFTARLDLHLLSDDDTDVPFERRTFRDLHAEDASTAECADALGVDEATIRRYRRVLETRDEVRRANHRYRDEFDAIFDRDLSSRMARDIRQDGLKDATDDMETNVSF